MKKIILVVSLLMLTACSNSLDTSKLVESKNSDVGMKFYSAPSVEVAIDSLPYEVNLPEQLPFNAKKFNSLGITDYGGKGLNPEASFITRDENTNELIITTTTASVEYPDTTPKEITLKNGYQAYYIAPNRLDVVVKNVTYLYTLIMPELDESQIEEELLKLAEQLSE